jgi:hypothetical protein
MVSIATAPGDQYRDHLGQSLADLVAVSVATMTAYHTVGLFRKNLCFISMDTKELAQDKSSGSASPSWSVDQGIHCPFS